MERRWVSWGPGMTIADVQASLEGAATQEVANLQQGGSVSWGRAAEEEARQPRAWPRPEQKATKAARVGRTRARAKRQLRAVCAQEWFERGEGMESRRYADFAGWEWGQGRGSGGVALSH